MEGKLTLPLIHLLATTNEREFILEQIQSKQEINLQTVTKHLLINNSLKYTLDKAREYGQKALDNLNFLKQSKYKQTLIQNTEYILSRTN